MFKGIITAIVTPFKNGALDEDALRKLINWHIDEGVHGIVFSGTTGESPTLTHDEYERLITIGVETVNKRVPVIAGTGTNSTAKTIENTKLAKKLGADGALVVMPYYNKPTQEGMRRHFEAIHEAVDIPIIIYNIPGRSGVDMQTATMAQLAKLKNIVGVKDATNDLARPLQIRRACGPDFLLLSGENSTFGAFLAQGGDGGILVTSNVAPRAMREMWDAWQARDIAKFMSINSILYPLHDILFVETNPAPVKYAVSKIGMCRNELRLPLVEVSPASQEKIDAAMKEVAKAGYIKL